MTNVPNGWAPHPDNPAFIFEVANPQNVQPLPKAAPAPAPAPTAGQVGTLDVQAFLNAHEKTMQSTMGFSKQEDTFVWVDLGAVQRTGDESSMRVRILPPMSGSNEICVPESRHRVFAEYVPGDTGKRQVFYYACHNQPGGPGDCPLCSVVEDLMTSPQSEAVSTVSNFKARTTVLWQVLNLDDPSVHQVQKKDASGMPIMGQWDVLPGVMRFRLSMHRSVLSFIRHKGDPTHVESGYPVCLVKRKVGPDNINVQYDAMSLDSSPLDKSLHPVLNNIIDIRKEAIYFRPREELLAVAESIRSRFGGSSATIQNPYAGVAAPGPVPTVGVPSLAPAPVPVAAPASLPSPGAPGLGAAPSMPEMPAMPPPPPAPGMPTGLTPQQLEEALKSGSAI